FRNEVRKDREDVEYPWPLMQRHIHTVGARPIRQPARVVEQDFIVADLDQQWRQAAQVAIDRRGEGVAPAGSAQIGPARPLGPGPTAWARGTAAWDRRSWVTPASRRALPRRPKARAELRRRAAALQSRAPPAAPQPPTHRPPSRQ